MRRQAAVLVAFAAIVNARPAYVQAAEVDANDLPAETGAQRRFQRGVELYKEGDLGGAQVEFKRAYELVPSYKILYNLGQVAYQRHDYASALRYFRQYLGEGDTQVPVQRQNEVAGEILRLASRVGTLEVDTLEIGAELLIDDVLVATTPLAAPITVNSGSRKVVLVARSGEHMVRQIEVAGGEVVRASFPRLALPPRAPVRHRTADTAMSSESLRPSLVAVAPPTARKSKVPWKSWVLTGLLAGGAAATGVIAWRAKQNLDTELMKFPLDPIEVDFYDRRTRGFALVTDGLLIGTSIMTAISLYLTVRDRN